MVIMGDELLRMSNEDIMKLYYGKGYKKVFEEERRKRELEEKEFSDFIDRNPIYTPRAVGLRGCFVD